jgi:hypothetical protein
MENKTSKYFKYAIGEIVLVVIGILIALQINNWNDAKKETKELHQYLVKIKNNIALDIKIVDSIKTRRLETQKACAIATKNALEDKFDLAVNMKAISAFVDYYFVPNKSGFEALKNSSYLGEINGAKIDSLLDNYYTIVNKIIKEEEGYNALIENMEYRFVGDNDIRILFNVFINGLGTLENDPSAYANLSEQIMPLFQTNSYFAVITRTASQTEMLGDYDHLINEGKLIISEIKNILND